MSCLNKLRYLLLLVIICSCSRGYSEWNVEHVAGQEIVFTDLGPVVDTIILDGRHTSLLGQWIMYRDKFYFFDECVVGSKVFDINGDFLSESINLGRGPDEMISPSWISVHDDETNTFVIQDSNANLHLLDSAFHIKWETNRPWFVTKSYRAKDRDKMLELYCHPDPDVHEIYEYNADCRRMRAVNNSLIMPVVSEHVKFNKYYKAQHSREYYKKAHILMLYPLDDSMSPPILIGGYPPIYKKGNLAVFSEYDFFINRDTLYISFAADPNIYQMDRMGQIIRSFGEEEEDISGQYPSTWTYEEYEQEYKKLRSQSGYYGRLSYFNGFIFRIDKLDGRKGWSLQVYDQKSLRQVGRIPLSSDIEIIGYNDPYYYAYIGEDLGEEVFKIIRFTL